MPVKKFAVITDSACDIPFELAVGSEVEILSFGITVDGVAYSERVDFNFDEYYDILRTCEGIPSTAHVTAARFLERFEAFAQAGCENVLYVSICGSGSATNAAAHMAKQAFQKSHPGSAMQIAIVDSHCYSMGYGWYVLEAEKRLAAGQDLENVAAWLNGVFTQVEILLAAYSLKFIKKSGRISAAAAFAGELLGLKPIVTLNDGVSIVQKKVRGDKEVLPALIAYTEAHRRQPGYMVGGTRQATIDELAVLCAETWGAPPACTFKLGAAVATNTGPDAIGIVYLGEKRARN